VQSDQRTMKILDDVGDDDGFRLDGNDSLDTVISGSLVTLLERNNDLLALKGNQSRVGTLVSETELWGLDIRWEEVDVCIEATERLSIWIVDT
jgi:hypothetical protein